MDMQEINHDMCQFCSKRQTQSSHFGIYANEWTEQINNQHAMIENYILGRLQWARA